jgi:XTP/dITP diphosphohydrolase
MKPQRHALASSVVLATSNAGKLREMRAILAPWQVDVRPLAEFTTGNAAETGLTFVENAILKARYASTAARLPAIADDSGLEVDALQGAPGVHSARYAGPGADDAANNARLLQALAGVPEAERTARYRCAMVYLRWEQDPAPIVVQACWEGTIAREPHGSGGFGYDPLFIVADEQHTAAQLPDDLKNRLSHRGQALRGLVTALAAGAS